MLKKTEYNVIFEGEPTILHHGTEIVDLKKILRELGASSISIILQSPTAKLNLVIGELPSRMTVTFVEHEEEIA